MNKFNWDLINQPSIVVHCETEEQATEFLDEADKNGFKWNTNDSYAIFTKYDAYEKETCYNIFKGTFADKEFYKGVSYKILKFEECKMKNKLEVTLKIQPDGRTVVAECTHIDEELRGKGMLANKDIDYYISSIDNLNLCQNILYVRGKAKHLDYTVDYRIFGTPQEAKDYVRIMNKLIDEINNPIIEINVNKNEDYEINGHKIEIYTDNDYTTITIRKDSTVIKNFYIDDKEIEGQPFDEVVEEFDNFCKIRDIKAKLVR